MFKKFAFLFLAFAMILSACRKDSDITGSETINGDPDNPIAPSEIVTAGLVGTVTDEYDAPVNGAVVRIKNNTAITDENGNFFFANAQMEVDGALVTVDKSGYFKAFDRVRATANQTSFTRIQLLDRSIITSFPAGAATDATFDGATVKFQSNGFVDANGNDYNGTVNVAGHWIDPTSDDLDQQMPGDLRALDMENQYSVLQSFGMVAVDLIADNGTELQLKEGMTAEVNFPIPAEIANNAPASIPLWSFDEELGLWREEGSASKVGNMYVGNVSHFSFWNCDAPFPLVEMEGQLVDENGDPLDGAIICIDFADNSMYGSSGWTNDEGFFGGKIPKDEVLILTVKDDCYNTVFTMEIGPFTEDVNLGQIAATGLQNSLVTMTGSLVTCTGAPVTNGYVKITNPDSYYYYFPVTIDADGVWETQFLLCQDSEDIDISGYDLDIPLTSDITTITINPGDIDIDLGPIAVCNEIEEFLIANSPSSTYSFIDPAILVFDDSISNFNITLQGGAGSSVDSLSSLFLSFSMADLVPGTYTEVAGINYNEYDPAIGNEYGYSCQGICDLTVEITLFEDVGGFVEGSYSGTANDYTGDTIDISGSFRIKRE